MTQTLERGFGLKVPLVPGDRRTSLRIGYDVDQRQSVGSERLLERWLQIFDAVDPDALASAGARNGRVIDVLEEDSVGVIAEFNVLGVLLIAENAVVEHDQNHRQLHAAGGL